MKIDIKDIKIREDLYPRDYIDWQTAHQYAEAMKCGAIFPFVIVNKKDDEYILIDGRHRLDAHRRNGIEKIDVIVKNNLSDKEMYALSVETNIKHGKKFSTYERAKNARRLLKEFKYNKEDVSKITAMPIESFEKMIQERVIDMKPVGVAALLVTKAQSRPNGIAIKKRINGPKQLKQKVLEDLLILLRNGTFEKNNEVYKLIEEIRNCIDKILSDRKVEKGESDASNCT